MQQNEIVEMAPALARGPLAEQGNRFVQAALALPKSVAADTLKTWAIYYVFKAKESAFAKTEDPTAEIQRALAAQADFLTAFGRLDGDYLAARALEAKSRASITEVERETGDHYGNLFKAFDAAKYYDETKELLRERLARNGVMPEDLASKSVLDAGCGGGRYSVAWKQLGAGRVVGADFSEVGLASAKARNADSEFAVEFERQDVCAMTFPDDEFDIVFSNGVLHHSRDCEGGIRELVRVMKPGGWGWLYLIEEPGGYFWELIEVLRVVMKDVDNAIARNALAQLGVPTNRIFYILDHIMVPINLRWTDEKIRGVLEDAGARDIRRLDRGYDFDRIEHIHRGTPYSEMKYGVGEHRYVFTK